MADAGWARPRGNRGEKAGLRRGAWYRVVEDDGHSWLVIDIHHERPKVWSVVHEPHLVCPGCSQRRHVAGQPKEVTCAECGNSFTVDWADRA